MMAAAIITAACFAVFGGGALILGLLSVIIQALFAVLTWMVCVFAFLIQLVVNPRKAVRMWKEAKA
jgi:hypothetical protein